MTQDPETDPEDAEQAATVEGEDGDPDALAGPVVEDDLGADPDEHDLDPAGGP